MADEPRIWTHTVDYRKDGQTAPRALVNRGFWVHGLPRLIPLCRLLGHRAVVDGTEGYRDRPGYRWVTCDRCGVRPEPQGQLDPSRWSVGDTYGGPFTATAPDRRAWKAKGLGDPLPATPATYPPGPWPTSPRGVLGGQLVVGRNNDAVSVEFKVGNAGSEHVLAAHVHLGHLGALYLHVEDFGRGLQRRLNPRGYESRVTGLAAHDGHLYWRLWAKRDGYSRRDPCRQRGSVQIDPRTILWGPKRYSYENVGEPVTATVRMPHGDDHEVTLQLQRQAHGRARLRRKQLSWIAEWDARPGIPTRNDGRGRTSGSAVPVSTAAVDDDGWVGEACAAIAADMSRERARRRYRHAVPA